MTLLQEKKANYLNQYRDMKRPPESHIFIVGIYKVTTRCRVVKRLRNLDIVVASTHYPDWCLSSSIECQTRRGANSKFYDYIWSDDYVMNASTYCNEIVPLFELTDGYTLKFIDSRNWGLLISIAQNPSSDKIVSELIRVLHDHGVKRICSHDNFDEDVVATINKGLRA